MDCCDTVMNLSGHTMKRSYLEEREWKTIDNVGVVFVLNMWYVDLPLSTCSSHLPPQESDHIVASILGPH